MHGQWSSDELLVAHNMVDEAACKFLLYLGFCLEYYTCDCHHIANVISIMVVICCRWLFYDLEGIWRYLQPAILLDWITMSAYGHQMEREFSAQSLLSRGDTGMTVLDLILLSFWISRVVSIHMLEYPFQRGF